MLLWQEYKHEHPNGYQYSQFAARSRCSEVMRSCKGQRTQEHANKPPHKKTSALW